MEQAMGLKHIRIAELMENLENLDELINLHKQTTQNYSMIRQYELKRKELLEELKELFVSFNVRLEVNEPA